MPSIVLDVYTVGRNEYLVLLEVGDGEGVLLHGAVELVEALQFLL